MPSVYLTLHVTLKLPCALAPLASRESKRPSTGGTGLVPGDLRQRAMHA